MAIIEKTYKHVIPTAKEFFDSFGKKYSTRLLPDDWNANTAWTKTVLKIFEEMGRELKYRLRTEYLDIDMTWTIRHEDLSMIAVAIERARREILLHVCQTLKHVISFCLHNESCLLRKSCS